MHGGGQSLAWGGSWGASPRRRHPASVQSVGGAVGMFGGRAAQAEAWASRALRREWREPERMAGRCQLVPAGLPGLGGAH